MTNIQFIKEYAKSATLAPLGNLYRTVHKRNRFLRILPESIKTKSLFIHVPKTGGHSVGLSLYNRDPWHFRYIDYAGYAEDNDISLDEFFKFTIIRNPVERMVSMHNYYQGLSYVHHREIPLKLSPDIISFTNNWLELRGKLSKKKMRPFLYTQLEYVCGADGSVAMDYVGRLEDISNDFKYISAKVGRHSASLQHTNKSAKREKLSNSDRNYVADVFADEMALFQY